MKWWVLFTCSERPIWEILTVQKRGLQCTKQLRYWLLIFKLLHNKPSYLLLVHFIWNQSKVREFSMGLYGTTNGPIFTFSRASDLKFGTTFLQLLRWCVHCTQVDEKVALYDVVLRLESKICKMIMSHFTTLLASSLKSCLLNTPEQPLKQTHPFPEKPVEWEKMVCCSWCC